MLADTDLDRIPFVGSFALDNRQWNSIDEQDDIRCSQFVRSGPFDFELIGNVVDVVFRAIPIDVLKRIASSVPVDGLLDRFSQCQQVENLFVGLHQTVEVDVGQGINGRFEVIFGELVRLSLECDLIQPSKLFDEDCFQHNPTTFAARRLRASVGVRYW